MVFCALAATMVRRKPGRKWHGASSATELPDGLETPFSLMLHKLRMPCLDKRRAALSDSRSLASPGLPSGHTGFRYCTNKITPRILTTATVPEELFQLTCVFLLNAYWDLQRFSRLRPFGKTAPVLCCWRLGSRLEARLQAQARLEARPGLLRGSAQGSRLDSRLDRGSRLGRLGSRLEARPGSRLDSRQDSARGSRLGSRLEAWLEGLKSRLEPRAEPRALSRASSLEPSLEPGAEPRAWSRASSLEPILNP